MRGKDGATRARTVKNEIQTWTEFRSYGMNVHFFLCRTKRSHTHGRSLTRAPIPSSPPLTQIRTSLPFRSVNDKFVGTAFSESTGATVCRSARRIHSRTRSARSSPHAHIHACVRAAQRRSEGTGKRTGKKRIRNPRLAPPLAAPHRSRSSSRPYARRSARERDTDGECLFSLCLVHKPLPADTQMLFTQFLCGGTRAPFAARPSPRVCVCVWLASASARALPAPCECDGVKGKFRQPERMTRGRAMCVSSAPRAESAPEVGMTQYTDPTKTQLFCLPQTLRWPFSSDAVRSTETSVSHRFLSRPLPRTGDAISASFFLVSLLSLSLSPTEERKGRIIDFFFFVMHGVQLG